MNYLTNYYKNLSEQLQEKINLLESQLNQVNEDLEPGTVMQGYGSGAGSANTTQTSGGNSDLNNFLQAWGSSDPAYDYNGDGVVDGNDLGIHLSRMLDGKTRPSSPTTMASTAVRGTPGVETPSTPAGGAKQMRALDQPGVEKTPFAGTYNAGAGSQMPRDVVGKTPKVNSSKKGSGVDLTQVTNAGYQSAPKPKTPSNATPEMTIATMLNNKVMVTPTSNINGGQAPIPPTNYPPKNQNPQHRLDMVMKSPMY